ncbi:hypothetical protein [Klebsiella quasipneumoniae]|uniref:hypothetical protein n=1 Tax=Klebsiella quasipneumoniae TaxID=1463165 RepID=UPI0021F3BAC8|nr:hypothetical protein [Klebsiella quasipneumoniae]MCW9378884.1 hypothetical protein [Klebsiella quasipneumoniae]MCW9418236.1 hypothetical protein [Klebsiella quasipneumoniae]
MSNVRDEIRTFDLDQLRSLSEFVGGLIVRKENEPRRTVWRVCSDGICLGNFREDEYLKAAAFLLEKATEIDAHPDSIGEIGVLRFYLVAPSSLNMRVGLVPKSPAERKAAQRAAVRRR